MTPEHREAEGRDEARAEVERLRADLFRRHSDEMDAYHALTASPPNAAKALAHVKACLTGSPPSAKCPGCHGQGFWYSPDNGQVVTCGCGAYKGSLPPAAKEAGA